jgi:hypothetical protein
MRAAMWPPDGEPTDDIKVPALCTGVDHKKAHQERLLHSD